MCRPPFFSNLAVSEARASLAVVVIPQWMQVSERGFAFVTQWGPQTARSWPKGILRSHAGTHKCANKGPSTGKRTHTQTWTDMNRWADSHGQIHKDKKKKNTSDNTNIDCARENLWSHKYIQEASPVRWQPLEVIMIMYKDLTVQYRN